MTQVYFGLGSNIDAKRNIRAGVKALRSRFPECRISPVYRSRAVGFDGADFINLVATADTDLTARALRDFLRDVEDRHGRVRNVPKFSDRSLDIDILLYGDRVSDDPDLPLPRPEITRFAHVLKPMADLAPDLVCPGDGRTMQLIWAESGLDDRDLTLMDPAFLNI